jgi:hypothetical protein
MLQGIEQNAASHVRPNHNNNNKKVLKLNDSSVINLLWAPSENDYAG